tara:strand:- start:244 stop:2151 length:1908 start_codon:yes stop_codon:yes gene_type:complete
MKYLLLSVLVVLVAVMVVPDAFAKMYTDPDNRFSIEYPFGWMTQPGVEDWQIINFLDKYDWDAYFRVELYEDVSYAGTSDSNIFEEIMEDERELCNGSTYEVDEFVCYNYKVNDYFVVYTDENRKAYFIDQQYTKQYDSPYFPGEYSIRGTVLETHLGNDAWLVSSEIDARHLDKHLDKVISSSYSFNLSPGSTSTSFKKYTDDNNRFTIEYPDNWVLSDSHPDEIIAIQDKYSWRTNFQVFWIDGDTLDNRSDSKVLRAIERNDSESCDDQTGGIRKCSDFKILDSYVMYTDDNKKVYFIKETYTIVWKNVAGKITGKEYPVVSTTSIIYDGNGSWLLQTESHEEVFANHYDELIHMTKSFSLNSQSTQTYTPPPAPISCLDPNKYSANCIMPYFGAIVELDKAYYSSEDDVNIVITVPNGNENTNVIEYIGTDANSRVTIITSQGTLDFYKLKETGVDTGVFEGSISLNSVSTTGMGPWSGNIKTGNQDTITVQFSNTYCQNGIDVMMTPHCSSGNVDIVKAEGFVEGPSVATPAPPPPTESSISIPAWIKSNAGWWVDGTIDDSSFLQGIEYLINQGIIVIPPTTTSGDSGSQEVPAWVKKNAGWWVDGTIDDGTFVSGIQYLVQVGIIQVV